MFEIKHSDGPNNGPKHGGRKCGYGPNMPHFSLSLHGLQAETLKSFLIHSVVHMTDLFCILVHLDSVPFYF